jgi:hypothetical protein
MFLWGSYVAQSYNIRIPCNELLNAAKEEKELLTFGTDTTENNTRNLNASQIFIQQLWYKCKYL